MEGMTATPPLTPSAVQPELAALIEQIRSASAERKPLRLRGSGSKDWYGETPDADMAVLNTTSYGGIIDYEPSELVLTARSGTRLAEIEALLTENRQMLAFEPPWFGPDATLGGCIATGLAGPRRATAGSVRDYVLGAKLISGRGEVLRFGGQVMKNVAGYDVSRLLAGSMGTLGLIAEVSLKVLPLPFAEVTLQFAYDEATALQRLNQWGGKPLPLSASAWRGGTLSLRLSGAQAAVREAVAKLGGDMVEPEQAGKFWAGLREQSDPFFSAAQDKALWRLALPSTAPALHSIAMTDQLIEWGGAQRWVVSDADDRTVREIAAQLGGHATLWRATRPGVDIFTKPAAGLLNIMKRLKTEFDPAGIFNPGRMFKDF